MLRQLVGGIPVGSDMMTGDHISAPKVPQLWDLLTVDIHAEGAAGAEQIPLGQMDGAWSIALQQHAPLLSGGARNRNGGRQRSCIWVPRTAAQFRFGRDFCDTAKVHYRDAV